MLVAADMMIIDLSCNFPTGYLGILAPDAPQNAVGLVKVEKK